MGEEEMDSTIESLINKGNELYKDKNYKEAIECYEKATQLDPNNASAFYGCGNALSELAKNNKDESLFRNAFENYEKAILLNPNNASVFYGYGNALSELAKINKDESLFRSAFENYEKATQLGLNNASVFYGCGNALSELAKNNKDESLFRSAFENYEKATQLDPNNTAVLNNWAVAISDLAEIKQDKEREALFKSTLEKYEKAIQISQNDSYLFYNLGYTILSLAEIKQDESLFKEACEKFDKSIQLDSNNASAFYNWGYAILNLAKVKQDEDFQKKLEIFENASKEIDDTDTYLIKGELYFVLDQDEKAKEYFIKSKKSILEILTSLDEKYRKRIINETRILHLLLDLNNNDSTFFKETTKNLTPEQRKELDEYEKIYIRSIFIISLLHVKHDAEEIVAHYREKDVSQKLLFDNNFKFKLSAIDYSNDPSEGKTLLNFLYGEENHLSDEKLNNEEYETFASCFVFDYDNLNMFRLYGKEQGKEGTGLSLVFRGSFFSNEAKMALQKTESSKTSNDNSIEKDKFALYRCIYIDPKSGTKQPVVTVGQKEEYLFYREEIGDKFENYNKEMNKIIENVRSEMKDLKDHIEKKNLDFAIVGQLLINLRYLVKHVAFKEEQECRIVKIHHLNDKEIKIKDDYKQMYIEYPLTVSTHIDRIYFGPKTLDYELFKSILKNKKLNIRCEKTKNPWM